MELLTGLEELRRPYFRPVVTIGNFDGVHKGHQGLFAKCRERAAATEGTPTAMTFEPHPMRVLRPAVNLPLITPLTQKLELIEENQMAVTLCVRFDEDFARLTADAFVDKLLAGRLGAAEVVVGYDFTFGRKGLGDAEFLRAKGGEHGFAVHVVGPVLWQGRPISSTRVRQAVQAGDLDLARKLLGRHYRIAGKVVTGHGRGGRLLGFPTANLAVTDELLPGTGVYAVFVELENGGLVSGVANIGHNPTFADEGLSVETHLLDFEGDLYNRNIKVHFVARLREEMRFTSPEELSAQIGRDVENGRTALAPWLGSGLHQAQD